MVPVAVQTLIVSTPSSPSIIVLRPLGEEPQNGVYRIVPIWVGATEAAHMGLALEQTRFERPTTHDLFLDALTNLDTRIDHVLINEVKKSTFHAQLVLRQHDRLIQLDSRPSDALALAVRQKAPLYIEEDVLEKASFPYVVKRKVSEAEELAEFKSFLEDLAPEDFEQ